LRFGQRNLLVTLPVQHQEGTGNLLRYAIELERLQPLHRLGLRRRVQHPENMLRSNRQRRRFRARDAVETVAPDFLIIPLCAPGDATGEALLEGRRARRVIAAEADRHDANPLWVDLGPRREIVVGRRGVTLGLMVQIKIAEPDAFAVPRSVHDQAGNAARSEISHALVVLNLLGDIEAVEENHRGHLAGAICRLGVYVDRRQTRSFVWDLDMLQARPLDVLGGVSQAVDAAHVRVEPFLALRLQEAFADVIIDAGALEILRAARGMSLGYAFPAAILDRARLARPFPKPSVVVADLLLQSQPDAIDFADFRAAPRRHIQTDQKPVRPAVIFRKIDKG